MLSAISLAAFPVQYITAAMVARHVPRGGARLIDLSPKNAAGRNLFYLPKDAVQVTVFDGKDKGAYLQELGQEPKALHLLKLNYVHHNCLISNHNSRCSRGYDGRIRKDEPGEPKTVQRYEV
jgi:hypothetical protein